MMMIIWFKAFFKKIQGSEQRKYPKQAPNYNVLKISYTNTKSAVAKTSQ